MSASVYFSARYGEARAKFLAAAEAAGARLAHHQNPASGPDGEGLFTDTARFGPERAERVLLIKSGTHGVEGFLGSGIETGLIESGVLRSLPAGVGCVMLHALNPYGFAWLRRTNEDNIDLNRNFVDHARPHPRNPGYDALKDSICPSAWTPSGRREADARLQAYGAEHGPAALQAAVTAGQYNHAEGVFYGGRAASWSNRLLTRLSQEIAREARQVAVIDLHSGLGPYGYGEIMNGHVPEAPGFARIEDWFGGEATSYATGDSSSSVTTGDTLSGIERAMPDVAVSGVTLEYGTLPLKAMIDAVRADNWLHTHGRLDSPQGREIKQQIRDAFYPDKDDWKAMVWERGEDVARRMLKGLSES
ncbi:hypothetical protein FRZ61_40300 [Hypericibacter adhaerens]|uniref:DUF2817 domain-containing protein n=1 Tax=Hypericibacter adhaerens TaxID=2602016 RepID=A0A5J6N2Y3_9PROT|nr:M14 family metallopeptidase [Hypericibacter adhaerens]QEX24089.1 hypothetical protein FRZ61_40300 [Hypericibacter adhaerens]